MTWRAMNSLLVLRDQVNALAPNRSKASDGLVGDAAHQAEQSDHNPHPVAGVGPEMVTALDLTHDPANGFDSYKFAEVLRQHRDKRIKYVISNHQVFNSSTWSWHAYTGTDPHTNHVHISVLDAPISDTSTLWNLEGFDMPLTAADVYTVWYTKNLPSGTPTMSPATAVLVTYNKTAEVDAKTDTMITQINELSTALAEVQAKLDQVLAKLDQGSSFTFPATSNYTATNTGTIVWNPPAA